MKKNSYSIKKPKWGLIALMAVFFCLFGNGAVAQVANTNFHWGGTVDNSWSNMNNWSKTGRYVHTANYSSGSTTVTIVTANLQGAVPTTVLAVGHAIVGPGIPANTTVTAFSAIPATGVTIELSQATTADGSAAIIQTYLKSTSLPVATTGTSTSGTTSTVIIDNAALGSPVITTNPSASVILMRNQFGPSSGTTLTINSGASLTVNHYAASPVSLAGGNIVNNGTLSITSTSVAASTGIVCITPTAAPSVATEYGYSGSGALNINLSASTTANSAGISVTSLNANTTYKILFDGTTSISLGNAATSFALRTAGGVNASSLIVGGAGFTMGTVGSPVNGGLLSLGAQSSVTVNSGTTLTLNSASTNITRGITSFSASEVATNFTNNGTINIQGASTNSGLFFSVGTGASAKVVPFNISNVGTLNLNMSCSGMATAVLATGNGGGGGATGTAVNINNSGTLTLKNTSTATGTGFAILGSITGEAPPIIITNSGTLNLEGSVASYGLKTSIINSGILNTNSELRSFSAITNANGASINFVRTAATATSKLVTFNVVSPGTTSASAGATFSLEGNTYTVIFQKFAAAFGTTLYTSVISSADTSALSQSGTLTYVAGTASGNIAYGPTEAVVGPPAVEAVAGFSASSVSGALTSSTANSGTINTDTASDLNILSGVSSTSSTSVIAPGGSSGKGIADFKRYSWLTLNGKVQIQVSGNTTAGVDYDQLNNSFDYGGIDISDAVLDLTGIYTPSADLATPIDIMNTGTLTPLVGTFASVTGLGTGWSVVYNYPNGELINPETSLPYVPSRANGGKVQLVYATPAPPTITQLSSNGTDTITQGCAGSTLVILGTNFTGTTGVTVNGVALTGVTVNSNTKITAVLPTGATSGQVVVTNAVSPSTSTAAFTVVANTTTITAINACDSYYWANTGTTYTVGGVYTGTTTNCETQQLNLTISTSTPPPTTTVVACGTSYVWPSNGVTYTTPGTKTAVVGCVTETLNLSFQSSVTPTFDAVAAICTGGSLTALPTTSTNSIPGTWSPALNNLATTEYTFTPAEGQCASTATLTITVNGLTTNGSVTTSICAGGSYTWPANGVIYTEAQTAITHTVDCNTATLNLTVTPAPASAGANGSLVICAGTSVDATALYGALTGTPAAGGTWSATSGGAGTYTYTQAATSPCTVNNTATVTVTEQAAPNAGTDGALSLSASPSDESLFAALTGAAAGGSWTRPGSGFVGVYTYTVNATAPCTGNDTSTVTVTSGSEIPATFPGFCKGATIATATGSTSLKFYTAISGTAAAVTSSTALATKTYYVTETIGGVESSPRVARAIVVNNLPATPSALASLEAKNICKYIGSSTPVTFTATAVNASSYIWTAPEGAVIENDGAQAFISFENVSATPGLIGSVTVKIEDTNGCISAAKALTLTTVLPKAPTALTLTSADTAAHFKGIITPADPTAVPPTPAVTGLVGLNSLVKITKVGPYMGTDTVFTLTAPEAITAASYVWTLPTGVNQLSGGTSNVITVDFADVEPGIGSLPIVVQSVGGCGNSINRTLTLARALPSAPTKLVLTDDAISTTTAVTKVGPYTGKSTALTLTATPFATQGGTATSYAWILPAGVNCETSNTPTTVKVKSSVNTGTVEAPIYEIQDVAAIATASSTITINFDDVESGVTSLPIQVFGVNGAGNSIARTLALTAAVPATPAIVGSLGTGSATQFSSCATKTYTATLIPGATYAWTLPEGATIVGAEDGNVIVVDYSNTTVAIGATGAAVTCTAINGTGASVTKSLTVKRVVCPAPGKIAPEAATTEKFSAVAYPNPATEGFKVKSSNGKSFGVQVYDMLGRSIEQRQMSSDAQIGSNYAKGVYNVIVNQGANVKTLRVIKQ